MKYFSSILLLMLLAFAGNIRAEELPEQQRMNSPKLFTTNFNYQPIGLLEGIQDDQETNEMDGFDVCFIHQAPKADPLQTSINTIAEVNSVIVPVHINLLLIDLPPPLS